MDVLEAAGAPAGRSEGIVRVLRALEADPAFFVGIVKMDDGAVFIAIHVGQVGLVEAVTGLPRKIRRIENVKVFQVLDLQHWIGGPFDRITLVLLS